MKAANIPCHWARWKDKETNLESESGPRTAENANRIVHDHVRVALDSESTASVFKLGHRGHVVCLRCAGGQTRESADPTSR